MTKTCICDGCGWNGPESECLDIDLNEWAGYSDYNQITALPVGECPECYAPVYTTSACDAWDLAKAAPKLQEALESIKFLSSGAPDAINMRSIRDLVTGTLQSLKG